MEDKAPERHEMAYKDGGFILRDTEGAALQAFKDIFSDIGSKFIKGQFEEISLSVGPVVMNAPITFLHGLLNDLCHATHFWALAAEETDPVKRMKLALTGYVSGHYLQLEKCGAKSPIENSIGDTIQRVFPDGTRGYCEKISSSPPLQAYLVEGRGWKYYGYAHYKAWLSGLATVSGNRTGKSILEFSDGVKYEISDPSIQISSIFSSEKLHTMTGELKMLDSENGTEGVVAYNPDGGFFKSWYSWTTPLADSVKAVIKKGDEVLAEGEGSWLSHLSFDKEPIWTLKEKEVE